MASAKNSLFSENSAVAVVATTTSQRSEALPDRIDIGDVNVPEWGDASADLAESRDLADVSLAQQKSDQYAALLTKERSDLSSNIINYAVFVFVAVYGYEIDRRTNLVVIAAVLFAFFTITTHVKARFNMAMQEKRMYGSGKLLPGLNVRLMDIATYFIAFLLIQVLTTRMRPLVADGHFSISGLVLAALLFVVVYVQSHSDQLRTESLHDPKDPFPHHEKVE